MSKQLILIITYKCNLNCSYCPIIKKNESISWDISKKSLDLFNKLKDSKKEIKFFGGEPLLEFNLIKKIVEYNRNLNKNVKYELTTNGIFLDKDKIDFFKKQNFELRISIDGNKATQIAKRGDESWKIFNELDKKDKKYIILNMVVSPSEASKFYKNFKFLFESGFRNFNLLPAFFNKWNKKEILIFNNELKRIRKFLRDNHEVYIKNKDIYKKNYLFKEGIVVDCNGDIYNTDKIMTKTYHKHKKKFKLCNIQKIKNFKKLNKNITIPNINNTQEHNINLILDKALSNFVESL